MNPEEAVAAVAEAQRTFKADTRAAREKRRRVFRQAAKKLSRRQLARAAKLSPTRIQQIIDGE